MKSTSNF
ncbi:hypothetical protein LINPERHAP1_LOCUS39512 [Linum perenne]